MNLGLFKKICELTQPQLLNILTEFLHENYDKVITTKSYTIAEGQIPVALVAHLDTVAQFPPTDIYYDQEEKVMWSPQLLGADDRAGVYAIIEAIQRGYRPHIIFVCDEEIGCKGAIKLVQDFKGKSPFNELKAIIELDRQGENDSVYYNCANEKFEKFINKYGFITDIGSFSDISVIAPSFKIAAVNLSVGYLNEHSLGEHLHTDWLEATIEKVCKILEDIDSYKTFKYIKNPTGFDFFPLMTNQCAICNGKLTTKNKITTVDGITICKKCFNEYYT